MLHALELVRESMQCLSQREVLQNETLTINTHEKESCHVTDQAEVWEH